MRWALQLGGLDAHSCNTAANVMLAAAPAATAIAADAAAATIITPRAITCSILQSALDIQPATMQPLTSKKTHPTPHMSIL